MVRIGVGIGGGGLRKVPPSVLDGCRVVMPKTRDRDRPSSRLRILVTGATGFVGAPLSRKLVEAGHSVRGTQHGPRRVPVDVVPVPIGDIGPETDWRSAVEGVQVVVHLAARVHVMREIASDPLAEFRLVNTAGTERLARQAAAAGVRRMVFVSSIKVNGEETIDSPIRASDPAAPSDAYGVSKWEAEQRLKAVAEETGLDFVVVRPPMVYGPGVQANFLRLLRAVDRGVPLPFRTVRNARSLVFLGNLTDLLARCVEHPGAAGATFLVSDGRDLSTPDLIRAMAEHLGRTARLVPVSPALLKSAGLLLNRGELVRRLVGSLAVDISQTRALLDWEPPIAIDAAMAETVSWYRALKG